MRKFKDKRRYRKFEVLEFNLTSLLDILVVILFFLILNYSVSTVSIQMSKDIKIPNSASTSVTNESMIIQISKEQNLWVDDVLVANLDSLEVYDFEMNRINPLYNELQKKRQQYSLINKQTNKEHPMQMINLIMDKDTHYDVIKRVMHTASLLGFNQFKFIVLGKS